VEKSCIVYSIGPESAGGMKRMRLRQVKSWILLFSIAVGAQKVWAFPENVRNGYSHCAACHVSPNGGGLLTPYGRAISAELLSTWGSENEAQFAYNLIRPPKWLNLGGDVRPLFSYRDKPPQSDTRIFLMQADLEAVATYGKVTIDGTFGYQYLPNYESWTDALTSRRHYLLFQATDEISLRFGKFYPAFGIYTDNHYVVTRHDLGFDQGMESYNFEAAWQGDPGSVFLTGIFGRFDSPDLRREMGFATRTSLSFADRYQVGLSYLYGSQDQTSRHVIGPFGILGFTPHFFLLTETDFQRIHIENASSGSGWGAVDFQRLDYEWIQGVHTYIIQEYSRRLFSELRTLKVAYGLGFQFFPRPHWELRAEWTKRKELSSTTSFYDFFWLQLHLYL
jgi:hypothetical protein